MALNVILPWFPVVLAVGLAGRLSGRERGFAVGALGGVFWLVLVHASEGPAVWQGPWTVLSILVGSLVIAMVGAWAGGASVRVNREPEAARPEANRESDDSPTGLAELCGVLAGFDDWLDPHRGVPGDDPWADFGEFIRTALFHCCRAAHVRPYRLSNGGQALVPLRNPDPLASDAHLPARQGLIGHVVTTGRMFVAGDASQGDLVHQLSAGGEPVAWCFAVSHGNRRLGAVVVGQLDMDARAHRALLEASARLISQCWALLWETIRGRAAAHADAVSGLSTRETFLRTAAEVLRESYAQGEPAAVAVVAIEGLRGLNDAGRWEVADELVREVAGCLRDKLRTDDLLCRFDDSRFVVLLRRVDSELAALIVGQLLGRVRRLVERGARFQSPLTVRCGLSGSGTTRPDPRALVAAALAECTRARVEGAALTTDLSSAAAGGERG
jgi:diguanylate cyclase (GGDEF)-like protein